jgi:hypothetical protein
MNAGWNSNTNTNCPQVKATNENNDEIVTFVAENKGTKLWSIHDASGPFASFTVR